MESNCTYCDDYTMIYFADVTIDDLELQETQTRINVKSFTLSCVRETRNFLLKIVKHAELTKHANLQSKF